MSPATLSTSLVAASWAPATSSAGILTVASAPLYLPVYASGLQGHWNAYNLVMAY